MVAMEPERELVKLENNGKCLFCKTPPEASKQLTFYSVQTLLEYLQMGQVKVRVKPEAEGEQADQFTDVDLQGPVVNAALCEVCGDLVETFLELHTGMLRGMRLCLASIQTKMKVGEENSNVGMKYPIREGTIMREALQRLQKTHPGIVSMVSAPSKVIREPLEVVKIEEGEEDAERNVAEDPSSIPIISEDPVSSVDEEVIKGNIPENPSSTPIMSESANEMECSSSPRSQRKGKRAKADKAPTQDCSTQTRGHAMGMRSRTVASQENADLSQHPSRKRMSSETSRTDKDEGQGNPEEGSDSFKSGPRRLMGDEHRPFQCSKCGARFFQEIDRSQHVIRRNSNARNFKCDICSRTFNRNQNLLRHRKIHTQQKKYFCPNNGCLRKYSRKDSVKEHLRSCRYTSQDDQIDPANYNK